MKLKHPFVERQEGWLTYLNNGYVADRRIFLLASFAVILLGVYGWSIDNFAVEQHVYLHCPDDALGGNCVNPLYKIDCTEVYCREETLYPGYTYGEPPRDWTLRQQISVWLMILTPLIGIIVNHVRYNKNFQFDIEV